MYKESNKIIALIKEYKSQIDVAMRILLNAAPQFDYYRKVRKGLIFTKEYGDISFEFHGIGCLLKIRGCRIDFDYATDDGRFDMIDFFFLEEFYNSCDRSKVVEVDFEHAETVIEKMKVDGLLIPDIHNPYRFYLKEDYENKNPVKFQGWNLPLISSNNKY